MSWKLNQNSCEYANLHIMSFITTKFHEILLSGFWGVALTRKTWLTNWLTYCMKDWQTDWLTDGLKTLYPPQLVAWGIQMYVIKPIAINCLSELNVVMYSFTILAGTYQYHRCRYAIYCVNYIKQNQGLMQCLD